MSRSFGHAGLNTDDTDRRVRFSSGSTWQGHENISLDSQAGELGADIDTAAVSRGWDEAVAAPRVWWQTQERKVRKRINTLVRDFERNGNEGIGKPEPLKHGFHGYWSRRITDEHRLVYKHSENEIRITACRYEG